MARLLKHPWSRNRSDRIPRIVGKKGTKRSLHVDERGVTLLFVYQGANRHDSISLEPMLKGRIPKPENGTTPQYFCLDAAYVWKEDVLAGNGIIPQFRPRGEKKKFIEKDPTFKARRWIVDLGHSWFHRFRKLLPRYEKTDLSYNALNALTAIMMVLNKILVIYR